MRCMIVAKSQRDVIRLAAKSATREQLLASPLLPAMLKDQEQRGLASRRGFDPLRSASPSRARFRSILGVCSVLPNPNKSTGL